jgi:hypothetical protein
MIGLSNGLTMFGDPILLVGLIALTFAFLETERVWTRTRRRRGFDPGATAYLLDGLVLAGVALAFVGISTLFVGGLSSIARLLGGAFDGEQVGLLIVGIALGFGLVLAVVRITRGRRTVQDAAYPGAVAAPPSGFDQNAAEAILSRPPEYQPISDAISSSQPEYRPAAEPAPHQATDVEAIPSLALLQERWQPTARAAANVPTSFLELGQPQSVATRSRFAFASSLLALAFVALLVSGAILFRGQLISMLSGLDSPGGQVAAIGNGESLVQPNATAQQPVVNVSSAEQPPAPANEAQTTTKRVRSDELNVRARPGVDQEVVVVLTKGVSVNILTDARLIGNAVWVKVRIGDQQGWVDQSFLE